MAIQEKEKTQTIAENLSKSSLNRIQTLLDILVELANKEDTSLNLLEKFRTLYKEIPAQEKPYLFKLIVSNLEVRKKDIEEELANLLKINDREQLKWTSQLSSLRQKLESPRIEAFRRFINLSGGLKFLLDLRADVLALQRYFPDNLGPLDEDIAHLFNSWFQRGFLFLREITLDSSYRQIAFLKEHEMVHPLASLEQMGNRLGRDRRCFALYHRAMPEEPVIFIEVALTHGIVTSIHEIIRDQYSTHELKGNPNTAIFYSINNTQNGLAGLGLGKILIFQVVEALKRDRPEIKTFATLSPIPGFWGRYLKPILEGNDAPFSMKRKKLELIFSDKTREELLRRYTELSGKKPEDFFSTLISILSDYKWIEDPAYCRLLKYPMINLTHFYITKEKDKRGLPLNPVANFHMGNGASVSYRYINFAANRSERGMEESCGMMVNYLYSRTWLQKIQATIKSLLPWKSSS